MHAQSRSLQKAAWLPEVANKPPEAKIMVEICWVMVTLVMMDMHPCVSLKYQAALRGPWLQLLRECCPGPCTGWVQSLTQIMSRQSLQHAFCITEPSHLPPFTAFILNRLRQDLTDFKLAGHTAPMQSAKKGKASGGKPPKRHVIQTGARLQCKLKKQ